MKYKGGDIVKWKSRKGTYVVMATKTENPKNIYMTTFDYVIQELNDDGIIIDPEIYRVFEDDIYR